MYKAADDKFYVFSYFYEKIDFIFHVDPLLLKQ